MPSDLGKAALIAAIAMAISDLWSVAVIADAMEGPIADRAMIWLICPLLASVPLPVFLFILYRTRVSPMLTESLRRTALVLALILVTSLAVFCMGVWRSVHQPASGPFFATPVWHTIFDVAEFSTQAAMIFFLLTLFRPCRRVRESCKDEARLVRKAALIAAIAGALALLSYPAFTLLFGIRSLPGGPGAWVTLQNVLFGIPAIAAPLIVYAGVRGQTAAATGLD